jgi:hypothetical protein
MRSAIAALVLMVFMPTVVMAQAFDWSAQLGKSPFDLEAALSQAGDCKVSRVTLSLSMVKMDTYLTDDLSDLIVTREDFRDTDDGYKTGRLDYEPFRKFSLDKVTSIACTIGREASVKAYAFEDRIVRIKLTFDRCEERKIDQDVYTRAAVEKCIGTDLTTRDFDRALYQAIEARNTYGYRLQNMDDNPELRSPWELTNKSGEFEKAQMWGMADVGCPSLNISEANRVIIPFDRKFRCLIDVDNRDLTRWSVTAMHEIFRPGMFEDTVERRLASMRLFIDLPAERAAAQTIRPDLQTMIDDIKANIAARATAERTKRDAVSNILGGGN